MLVSEYDLGLKVSKEYHLNCITSDKEIVYSEGFLCKVGKDTSIDDKLELYFKYEEKSKELLKATSKRNARLQTLKEL